MRKLMESVNTLFEAPEVEAEAKPNLFKDRKRLIQLMKTVDLSKHEARIISLLHGVWGEKYKPAEVAGMLGMYVKDAKGNMIKGHPDTKRIIAYANEDRKSVV